MQIVKSYIFNNHFNHVLQKQEQSEDMRKIFFHFTLNALSQKV